MLRLESQQTQLRSEIAQTTAEQMEDLRDQVQDILRQQRDLLAEGSSLLSDFGAAVEDVAFRTEGSAITVSAWAVPKTWREGHDGGVPPDVRWGDHRRFRRPGGGKPLLGARRHRAPDG